MFHHDDIDIQIKDEIEDDQQNFSFSIKMNRTVCDLLYHKPFISEFENNGMSLMSELQLITDLSTLDYFGDFLTENDQDLYMEEQFADSSRSLMNGTNDESVNYEFIDLTSDENTEVPFNNLDLHQEVSGCTPVVKDRTTFDMVSPALPKGNHNFAKHRKDELQLIDSFELQQRDISGCTPKVPAVEDRTTFDMLSHALPKGNHKQKQDDLQPIDSFKSTECGKSFTRKYNLNKHCKMKHKSKSIKKKVKTMQRNRKRSLRQRFSWKCLECNVCGQRFSENKILAKHMVQHQQVILKCPICEKSLNTDYEMDKHLQVHESFKNSDSNFKHHSNMTQTLETFDKEALKKATATKTTDVALMTSKNIAYDHSKDHLCQVCGRNFSTNDNLKRHKQTVHEGLSKDHLCQVCGQNFSTNANLKRHERTVHEGVRDFMCKVCGKEFSNRRGMLNHERVIHRGIKAFECEICGIRFGLKSNLTRHIKIHQGTESFSCE
eukprot:TCONS_00055293-protein